ncbi:MAG: hypothetical protein WC917_00450 [Bacilli bacterium]|jgi:hypothetical protein
MAHTITPQVLEQGPKFTVVKYTIAGDSKDASELSNAVLFDASVYSIKTKDKLVSISYCLNGFSAQLLWDASAKVPLISIPKDHPYDIDYIKVAGGLKNNAGTGITGDVLITTLGLASTSYVGHILLWMAWK